MMTKVSLADQLGLGQSGCLQDGSLAQMLLQITWQVPLAVALAGRCYFSIPSPLTTLPAPPDSWQDSCFLKVIAAWTPPPTPHPPSSLLILASCPLLLLTSPCSLTSPSEQPRIRPLVPPSPPWPPFTTLPISPVDCRVHLLTSSQPSRMILLEPKPGPGTCLLRSLQGPHFPPSSSQCHRNDPQVPA